MTNAEIIAKIKAEIAYRIETYIGNAQSCVGTTLVDGLEEASGILSDLEKSLPAKVADDERLEIEIERVVAEYSEKVQGTRVMKPSGVEKIARHFYDLGCRRTAEKYDEIEYNRQREEGRVLPGFEDEPKGIPGKDFVPVEWVETLEMYGKWKIVRLEEYGSSEMPKDLDKAARKSAVAPFNFELDEEHLYEYPYLPIAEQKFKEGAKWQKQQDDEELSDLLAIVHLQGAEQMKEQMMKEAVEADVNIYRDLAAGKSWAEFVVEMPTNNLGDKVRIIIVKED